ncbi:MAG: PQQ-binding-like beta-propeller repeat protein [Planctomycetaceae bacterium]
MQSFFANSLMLAGFLAMGFGPVVPAADWTQFRGPNGSAVSQETGLPTSWSETENLKWKTKLPGYGASSPITWKDKVFVTCYSGYGTDNGGSQSDLMRHVVCVDRNSGNILWDTKVKPYLPEDRAGGFLSGHGYASSTPVTDGERVYVFFGKTGVLAFDMNGKQLWKTSVGTGSAIRGWGSGSSPILYKDKVIVNASAEGLAIVALDKTNGKQIWKAKADGLEGSWCTPVVVKGKDGMDEIVVAAPYEFWALNPKTGKLLWYADALPRAPICTSLVAHDGVVYAIAGRSNQAAAVRAGGRGDVTKTHVLWKKQVGSYVTSPVYHKGHLYWVSDRGIAYCVDAKTGNTVYRGRLSGARSLYASAVAADGKIYAVSRRGGTFVLAAKPKFEQLKRNQFASDDSLFNATPAISNGCLFLRSNKYLYCLKNSADGK